MPEPEVRVGRGERRGEVVAAVAVARAARREDRRQLAQQRLVVRQDGLVEQPLGRQARLGAERRGEGGGVEGAGEGLAVPGDLQQQRVGVGAAEPGDDGGEDLARVARQRVEHLLAQRLRLPVVEHGELRRDAGLQREAAQQALAEGVDRLDAQPARRLQRPGEEGAGAAEPLGRDALAGLAEGAQRRAQLGVAEHRPAPERAEQPVLHLRRGGLGVGQAEDALRLGAGEQQPRHPVGQHPGLARAGVGGDPARRVGPRRAHLAPRSRRSCPGLRVGLVAVGPLAPPRQVVVVARVLARPQARDEAGAGSR